MKKKYNYFTRKLDFVGENANNVIRLIGNWNAATNTPHLPANGATGDAYIVSVAGNTEINGETDWHVKDWIVLSDNGYVKINNADAVVLWGGISGNVMNQTDVMPYNTSLLDAVTQLTDNLLFSVSTINKALKATIGQLVSYLSQRFFVLNKNNTITGEGSNIQNYISNGNQLYTNHVMMLNADQYGGYFDKSVWAKSTTKPHQPVYSEHLEMAGSTNLASFIIYKSKGIDNESNVGRYGVDYSGKFFVSSGGDSYYFPAGKNSTNTGKFLKLVGDNLIFATPPKNFTAIASNRGMPINMFAPLAKHCTTNSNTPAMPTFNPYDHSLEYGSSDPYIMPFTGKLKKINIAWVCACIAGSTIPETVYLGFALTIMDPQFSFPHRREFWVPVDTTKLNTNNSLNPINPSQITFDASPMNINISEGLAFGWYLLLYDNSNCVSGVSRVVSAFSFESTDL